MSPSNLLLCEGHRSLLLSVLAAIWCPDNSLLPLAAIERAGRRFKRPFGTFILMMGAPLVLISLFSSSGPRPLPPRERDTSAQSSAGR